MIESGRPSHSEGCSSISAACRILCGSSCQPSSETRRVSPCWPDTSFERRGQRTIAGHQQFPVRLRGEEREPGGDFRQDQRLLLWLQTSQEEDRHVVRLQALARPKFVAARRLAFRPSTGSDRRRCEWSDISRRAKVFADRQFTLFVIHENDPIAVPAGQLFQAAERANATRQTIARGMRTNGRDARSKARRHAWRRFAPARLASRNGYAPGKSDALKESREFGVRPHIGRRTDGPSQATAHNGWVCRAPPIRRSADRVAGR